MVVWYHHSSGNERGLDFLPVVFAIPVNGFILHSSCFGKPVRMALSSTAGKVLQRILPNVSDKLCVLYFRSSRLSNNNYLLLVPLKMTMDQSSLPGRCRRSATCYDVCTWRTALYYHTRQSYIRNVAARSDQRFCRGSQADIPVPVHNPVYAPNSQYHCVSKQSTRACRKARLF